MDAQIALILFTDGVANGAIYLLIALGIVLIFSVTRIIFVPFGDIAALTALTVAAIQLGRLPGTVWLVAVLAAVAVTMELAFLLRRGQPRRIPGAIACYAALPMLPVAAATLLTSAGLKLPQLAQMLLHPAGHRSRRFSTASYSPMANASVLVLLIVARRCFAISARAPVLGRRLP
jgi:branched-chain amino acid transport system permease protein